MTGRDLANIEAAVTMLQQGRTAAACELLAGMIREHGGVPPSPPDGSSPPPKPDAAAMRMRA